MIDLSYTYDGQYTFILYEFYSLECCINKCNAEVQKILSLRVIVCLGLSVKYNTNADHTENQ